jgi:GT2 family glycosyltransferase/glycosyltransferase involved in cell wall biosynthesis
VSVSTIIPHTLLVSGPNGGGLALVRRDRVLPVSRDSATGIAVDRDAVAWCLQMEEMASTIAILRDGVLITRVIDTSDLDLHDLAPAEDSWYAVATLANAVLHLDREGHVLSRHEFGGEPDSMHLNSICNHNGRLLVSAFGRFAEQREYKGRTRGTGLVLDIESGETLIDGLSQPHSLVSHGEWLYFCDSERSEVVRWKPGGVEQRVKLPGYTRGLCVAGDNLYVGISRSRNQSERSVESFPSALVAVLHADNLGLTGYVPFEWDEIYDIKAIEDDSQVQSLLMLALETKSVPASPVPVSADIGLAELGRQLSLVESRLVAAISHDIRVMQDQHAEMMQATERAQSEFTVQRTEMLKAAERAEFELEIQRSRAERAERFGSWAAQVWGDATEQRQAMEALTEAVTGMESRLARAISEDIRRMQEAHGELLKSAGRLEGELTAARAALMQAENRDAAARATIEALQQSNRALESRRAELESQLANAAMLHSRQEAELLELRRDAEQLALVYRSASWRVTRPFRFVRRLVRHGIGLQERARLAQWIAHTRWVPLPAKTRQAFARHLRSAGGQTLGLLPDSNDVSVLPQLAPLHDMPDVFVWAVIDWHFRTQRPQHLAQALAKKGHRVFYISNLFVDAPQPGFAVDDLAAAGRLFQVHLNVAGAPSIYSASPDDATLQRLASSLSDLLAWTGTRRSVSIVQHPYWTSPAQFVPNARIVYDCMDHHAGFHDNTAEALALEQALAKRADLVVTTSAWLENEMVQQGLQVALVRNGTDFDHFRDPPNEVYRDPEGRRIIGYIGAIAEWFDVDIVRRVAEQHSECAVVLVGADTAAAASLLADVPNVRFIGEVPYARLPYWLHSFDVCLLPFLVIPLTLATNPVKIYEYLSAGKPVVATDLPEIAQFGELVEVASTPNEFADAVGRALQQFDTSIADARRAYAAGQTWAHRAAELDAAIAAIEEPRVSVVVLTYNNLDFTEACLFSIEAYSDYPNLEVIVVDNASTDGTREYLQDWVTKGRDRKIILNDDNRGFAAGNNQGMEAATGEFLVILNNDTYVTPGWIRTLASHLRRDPSLGIVGPVTNNIGNEARIEIAYADMAEMIERAGIHTRAHAGRLLHLPVVAFFCVMLRRSVWERLGGLDERFGLGFFEDDDYCRRVAEIGMKVGCAEDVFVHHHLSATFNQLQSEKRQELFERNQALYEEKWGAWLPHSYR